MSSAWEIFEMELTLVLSEEEIEKRFRELRVERHPDAGGKEGEFEELEKAKQVLVTPGRRLEAWLKIHDVAMESTGAISEEVADMFVRVNEVMTGVDQWRENPKVSGLGKALWQKEGFEWKERVESVLDDIAERERALEAQFGLLEKEKDWEAALQVRGAFGFVMKWKANLRASFGKIWEGLI